MWKHNKVGIMVLLGGLAALGGVYAWLAPQDKQLAEQVVSAGVCALLFAVGLASFLSVRPRLR